MKLRILSKTELTKVDSDLENSSYYDNKTFLKRQKQKFQSLNDGIWPKKAMPHYIVVIIELLDDSLKL